MIKNRSITQPKLLTSETTTPRAKDAVNRTSASPALRPEVNGILPQTINRHKVNKSHFMSINALPIDMEVPKMSPIAHVIPTAVCEINDSPNKKMVRAPDANKVFKSRSKSTLLSSSLANLAKTGPTKFKKNSLNSDIPEDPFKTAQNSGRNDQIYTTMEKLVDQE